MYPPAGLGVGVLYGTTNVAVGHPFDTIKTKMQAQHGFESQTMIRSFVKTVRDQGVRGLYRGCVPPLLGSGVFRSTQFAVFEACYTVMDVPFARTEIPCTFGVQVRVVAGGVLASTARSIIETPLEYMKVRRQIQQSWRLRDVYTGFGVTWFRTIGLMTTYFILVNIIGLMTTYFILVNIIGLMTTYFILVNIIGLMTTCFILVNIIGLMTTYFILVNIIGLMTTCLYW